MSAGFTALSGLTSCGDAFCWAVSVCTMAAFAVVMTEPVMPTDMMPASVAEMAFFFLLSNEMTPFLACM